MRMALAKSTFEVVLASILGASAVLIVWGTLDAWQLAEFERVARVKVAGTTGRSDLTWYAADRAAAWSVGDQAPATLDAIDTVCRGHNRAYPRTAHPLFGIARIASHDNATDR